MACACMNLDGGYGRFEIHTKFISDEEDTRAQSPRSGFGWDKSSGDKYATSKHGSFRRFVLRDESAQVVDDGRDSVVVFVGLEPPNA